MINVKNEAEKYFESAVELLKMLVSYPSVLSEPKENMPYGESCALCLNAARSYLDSCGFLTSCFDNHAITAAFDEREPDLGILCHLDVVPAGDGWSSDPFSLVRKNGRLTGRGAIDDKGPAAAVITAMRIIKDSGIPLRKNVRIILGSNEENGSSDMEYYLTKESFPPMLFTPDGSFPVISIEKGMLRYRLTADLPSDEAKRITAFEGGTAVNAVPERAKAVLVGLSADEVLAAAERTSFHGISFDVSESDDRVTVCALGSSAHASTPEQGKNAVTALISLLTDLPLSENTLKLFTGIAELFPFGETDGSSVGVKCSDEKSGSLTLVPSIISTENNILQLNIDIRLPVSRTTHDITDILDKQAEKIGMSGSAYLRSEAHCADESSDFIRTLLKVYEDVSGLPGKCLAIGGGTYVHDTENGVAFGAEWEGSDNHMHGADEFITEIELKKDIEIYTETILRLCT